MMNMKISKPENTPLMSSTEWKQEIEGVDVPFGPPPEEYSYRCSHCNCELAVNEAIIDVEIAMAEFEGRCVNHRNKINRKKVPKILNPHLSKRS